LAISSAFTNSLQSNISGNMVKEAVVFPAPWRIMLKRINELLETNENFAFETTLATKSYKSKILEAKSKNYNVTLLFFWLQNVELAIERVKTRVIEGGHNIETEVIKRRYLNGIKNLFEIYLPIADEVMIFDNSEGKHDLIAKKTLETEIDIFSETKFNKLKNYYHENT
jgi:predicted ABC-type ATPase